MPLTNLNINPMMGLVKFTVYAINLTLINLASVQDADNLIIAVLFIKPKM